MFFLQCFFKTDVLTDRSEATLRIALDDGRALVFKLAHLDTLVRFLFLRIPCEFVFCIVFEVQIFNRVLKPDIFGEKS